MSANMNIDEQRPMEDPATLDQDVKTAKHEKFAGDTKDVRPSDEPFLSKYDKELADSFPASDPPTQP